MPYLHSTTAISFVTALHAKELLITVISEQYLPFFNAYLGQIKLVKNNKFLQLVTFSFAFGKQANNAYLGQVATEKTRVGLDGFL